ACLPSSPRVPPRQLCGGGPPPVPLGPGFSRHVYNSLRWTSNSLASATMFSHCFIRSRANSMNSFGNFPTRFLATCHLLYCDKCAHFFCLILGVQSSGRTIVLDRA